MFRSPSPLSESVRQKIGETLNATLAEGLDLHSQIKVAHWNVEGMLTGIIGEFGKNAWFLRASLES